MNFDLLIKLARRGDTKTLEALKRCQARLADGVEIRFSGIKFEVRAQGDGRTIEGYASTFEPPHRHDSYGDIIRPGAFKDAIERSAESGKKIKMLDHHGQTVGAWNELSEDDKGLFVVGRVSKTKAGNDLLNLIKDGAVDSLSIGFRNDGSRFTFLEAQTHWGEPVREWFEVNLEEVSPVTFPANPFATITSVRSRTTCTGAACGCTRCGTETKGEVLAGVLNGLIDDMATDETPRTDIIEAMGAAAGISASTVGQILTTGTGMIDCPPMSRLEGFAEVLGVDVGDLVAAAEADGCTFGGDEEGSRSSQAEGRRPKAEGKQAHTNPSAFSPARSAAQPSVCPEGAPDPLIRSTINEALRFNLQMVLDHTVRAHSAVDTLLERLHVS